MSAKNYWFAFGIGVTAGAAIALLYAPQTGTKTRKQLRKGVEDAGDYLEDAADYLKEQAERLSKEADKALKRTRAKSKTPSTRPETSCRARSRLLSHSLGLHKQEHPGAPGFSCLIEAAKTASTLT